MKKELPMPTIVGVIVAILVIIVAVLFWPKSAPASPEAAGLGKPALPGGGTQADPTKGPGGSPTR